MFNQFKRLSIGDIVGATFFSGLAVYMTFRFYVEPLQLVFLFKLLKAITIAIIFLIREKPIVHDTAFGKAISYVSVMLPFLYVETLSQTSLLPVSFLLFIFIIGEVISVSGVITLGKSFGVSPAKRSIIRVGLYKHLKHPIYTGYALTESSLALLYPTQLNFWLLLCSLSMYFIRSRREEAILN